MILLPLVDNAIKHGPRAGHRGTIVLRVARVRDQLVVELTNPGAYRGPRAGSEGLPALERRLALGYAGAAHVAIAPLATGRPRVELVLPIGASG